MQALETARGSLYATMARWLPRVAFLLYFLPLLAAPLVVRSNDVVAQADTASYLRLADDFSLSRHYGDAWAPRRTTSVVAEEHKVKHVLYVLALSTTVHLGKPLGFSTLVITQLLNALIAVIALAVYLRVLALHEVPSMLAIPLVCLFATAPGQWVYAGLPESWPLSGLLTVCLLFTARRWPGAPLRLGALAGVAMLNNPVLGSAALLVCVGPRAAPQLRRRLWDGVVAVAMAVLVWAGVLTILSAFDPAFRPDRYLAFLRWFRSIVSVHANAPVWFFRHAVVNSILLPFASSTGYLFLLTTAVEETWKASWIGRGALAAIVVFWLVVGGVTMHQIRRRTLHFSLGSLVLGPIAFLGVVWMSYYAGSPESMFLYSSTMIPVLLLLAALALARMRWAPVLVWVVWIACMPAAVQQIVWYRRVAFGTTLPPELRDDPAWPYKTWPARPTATP